MTSTIQDLQAEGVSGKSLVRQYREALIRPLFAAAVFTSAALVFLVEPMIGKLVLPTLGGSPAVWNTSVAFFQVALLLGYAYAHLLQRLASTRGQILVHLAVLCAAAVVLPLRVSHALGEPDGGDPTLWLLGVLALTIGLPFAALSATAPLIQAWYAQRDRGHAGPPNPYVLYAASNLGSLLALLAYPTVVEPALSLKGQTFEWSLGYGMFVTLIGAVALLVWQTAGSARSRQIAARPRSTIRWSDRLIWIALAAAPSSLLQGVTTHLTTDIASVPLFWVVPLGLYLLTFVIAFQAKPIISRETALVFQGAAFVACLATIHLSLGSVLLQSVLDLVGFFLTALVCHQALAARRPPSSDLTEFYLLMSLGGVLGGSFNAFLAPALFKTVFEYPLVLALTALARPWSFGPLARRDAFWLAVGLLTGAAAIAVGLAFGLNPAAKIMVAVTLATAFLLRDRTAPFLALCLMILIDGVSLMPKQDVLLTDRSFFGVVRLLKTTVPHHGEARLMAHGTTLHGAQLLDPAERCRPLLYYAPTTPIGQVFRSVLSRGRPLNIGAIGMGVGTVATYTRPGDRLRFFEIDPLVARLAKDPANFTYIHGCAKGQIDDVLGDARLTLAREPDDAFDILLVDAFSSDSIPAHLLTVEAMRGYLQHVKHDGIVIMHLSNNNLELVQPVAGIAKAAGGAALQQFYRAPAGTVSTFDAAEDAVIVARTPDALASFAADPRWKPAESHGVGIWTDDYTNLLAALVRGIGHIDREVRQ